jgi:prepilin-type N-terminal cleavage/methylation domain-containing protein
MRKISGFTLIELLMTVVIVGLLAAIALPRLSDAKNRAYVAAMRSDLRNLSTHEESHFYDHAVYSSSMLALGTVGFNPTTLVTTVVVEATGSGWSASASHSLSAAQCGLFVGNAAPVGGAVSEGIIACQ